jgi:hypothetical protein
MNNVPGAGCTATAVFLGVFLNRDATCSRHVDRRVRTLSFYRVNIPILL